MADIELVIKIPERIHYGIEKGITVNGSKASQILIDAVKNGTPLPKGHGRIVDGDVILTWLIYKGLIDKLKCGEIATVFERATIIEADKEQEDEDNN